MACCPIYLYLLSSYRNFINTICTIFIFTLFVYSSIGISLLSRDLLYYKVVKVGVISQAIYVVLVISLALFEFSYFALAVAFSIQTIIHALLTIASKPNLMQLKPKFTKNWDMINFGLYTTLSNLLSRVTFIAPDLILGRMGTTNDVAQFSRSIGLITQIKNILSHGISTVALPYFSSNKRNDVPLDVSYIKATTLTNGILLPAIASFSIVGKYLIVFLFGNQWIPASELASSICWFFFFTSIHPFFSTLLINEKWVKSLFLFNLVYAIFVVIILIISFEHSMLHAAHNLVYLSLLHAFVSTLMVKRLFRIGIMQFVKSQLSTWFIAFAVYFGSKVAESYLNTNEIYTILSLSFISVLIYVPLILVTKHSIWIEAKSIVIRK